MTELPSALSPHETIWRLASAYIKHAKQLVPFLNTHPKTATIEYQRDILAAIALLKSILSGSVARHATSTESTSYHSGVAGGNLSTIVEIKTRYKLARIFLEHTENDEEAIGQARKTIHLARGISGMEQICMGAYAVQIKIQIRQAQFRMAKAALREAQKESERLGLHGWYYHFIALQLRLKYKEMSSKDKRVFTAQLSILADTIDYARGNKHDAVQTIFLLLRAHYGLLANDERATRQALDEANVCLSEDLDDMPLHTSISETVRMARPHNGTSIMHARYYLLRILYGLHYGDAKAVSISLQQLRDIFNWWTLVNAELAEQDKHTDYLLRNEHVMQHMRITWLSRRQIMTFGNYLLAIAYHQTSSQTAHELMISGIRQLIVTSNGIQEQTSTAMPYSVVWYDRMRAHYWLLLVDVYLANNSIDKATSAWETVTVWCRHRNAWSLFSSQLVLRYAWIMQATGNVDKAKYYYGILQQCNTTSTIATLCNSLLDLANRSKSGFKLPTDIDGSSLTATQQVVTSLMGSFEDLPRQKKKQRLQSALSLANTTQNIQLHRFILARLAELYYSVADEESIKMLSAAYHLACTSNDHLLSTVVVGRLADLHRRHGRKETADHLYQQLTKHKHQAHLQLTTHPI